MFYLLLYHESKHILNDHVHFVFDKRQDCEKMREAALSSGRCHPAMGLHMGPQLILWELQSSGGPSEFSQIQASLPGLCIPDLASYLAPRTEGNPGQNCSLRPRAIFSEKQLWASSSKLPVAEAGSYTGALGRGIHSIDGKLALESPHLCPHPTPALEENASLLLSFKIKRCHDYQWMKKMQTNLGWS